MERVNDNIEHIRALIDFCKKISAKVNIIEYNPIGDNRFEQAAPEIVDQYLEYLSASRITATVRRSRGKDIDAACGQLANKNE